MMITKRIKKNLQTKIGRKKLLIGCILLILLLIAAVLLIKSLIANLSGDSGANAGSGFSLDHSTVHSAVDFEEVVLGESVTKKDLVVLEQDVDVDSELSRTFLDWSVFEKTKKIHSYGSGVFTVDLSGLTANNISVDNDKKTVTVMIPRTQLQYINIDVDKTEFEDTQHGFLSFGDIKLTQEEQQTLEQSIDSAMREALDTDETYANADKAAVTQVTELFSPLIKSIDKNYKIIIIQ